MGVRIYMNMHARKRTYGYIGKKGKKGGGTYIFKHEIGRNFLPDFLPIIPNFPFEKHRSWPPPGLSSQNFPGKKGAYFPTRRYVFPALPPVFRDSTETIPDSASVSIICWNISFDSWVRFRSAPWSYEPPASAM